LVDKVASVVYAGGTVIFPTDTVYGIGCDPARHEAIARIYLLKGRDASKALTLHLATVAEALEYTEGDRLAGLAIRRLLPGPVTLIVRRPRFVDRFMTSGLGTMGLRVPDHPVCSAILERCGPFAGTSANSSGSPAFTGEGDRTGLPTADAMVDDGPTRYRCESTILDLSAGEPRVVREGAVPVTTLERVLGPIGRPDER
jgi:L-threonylcarbamoyladenylate synthase